MRATDFVGDGLRVVSTNPGNDTMTCVPEALANVGQVDVISTLRVERGNRICFLAGDGKFGVNSASLRNVISCLVSVRTNGCVKVSIVLMFLLNSCCLFLLVFYSLLLRFCITCIGFGCVFAVGQFQSSCCAVIFIARDCNP